MYVIPYYIHDDFNFTSWQYGHVESNWLTTVRLNWARHTWHFSMFLSLRIGRRVR